MRGSARSRAAFWLVPALASARSLPPAYTSGPSALVSVPLFGDEGRFETDALSLRFDVLESQEACGHTNVTINGQTLPETGHGALAYDPWTSLVATWTSVCVEWNNTPKEQLLNLVIESLNGSMIPNIRLGVSFQQVAPVWITELDSSGDVEKLAALPPPIFDDGDDLDETPIEGLEAELADLERLRRHAAELELVILARERSLRETYGWGAEASEECDSWRCFVQSLVNKVAGTAASVLKDISEHASHHRGHHSHGDHTFRPHHHSLPPPQTPDEIPHELPEEPPAYQPIVSHPMNGAEHPMISPDEPLQPDTPERPQQPVRPSKPAGDAVRVPRAWHALLYVKIIAVISMFFFFMHLFLRCNRSCAVRRERRRQRRAARQARREIRARRREAHKAAIKAALKGFFRRIFPGMVEDEEKAAMVLQPESDTESDLGNTMEQEIAQFRAAANVVGDMINAAEEGRTQQRRRRPEYQPPPEDYTPTPPSPGAFAEYMPEDDIPPAYEERRRALSITAESSVVSDGFRYTLGSSNYTPSTAASQPDDEPPKY